MPADPLQAAIATARAASLRYTEGICKLCGQLRTRHRFSDSACPASHDGSRFRTSRFEPQEMEETT